MGLNLAFFSLRVVKQSVDQPRRLAEMSGLAITELPYHDGAGAILAAGPWVGVV